MELSTGEATRVLGTGIDARDIAARLSREPAWFWLDGSGAPEGEPRVSYLGVAAETLRAFPGEERAFLDWIAGERGVPTARADDAPAFSRGWVAALGYEFGVALLGGVSDPGAASHPPAPTGFALRADVVLALDHETGEAVVYGPDGVALDAWVRRFGAFGAFGAGESEPRATAGRSPDPRWRSTDDAYLTEIDACLHAIREGDAYVLCLTDTAEVDLGPGRADPLEVFNRLRSRGPALRGGVIVDGDWALVSASPERFLSVRGSSVRTDPIKGTRPRGRDPESDAALARDLAADPKERSENLMIVDLMRNDLTTVCDPATVGVEGFLRVETHPHVHQLVSTVRGTLRPEAGLADAVAACFPGGSMTGAPKRRAVELLREIEPGPRGLYSGCFGWFGANGDAELAMTIRSVELSASHARVGAGGGITADSAPLRELEEKALKARPLLAALGGAAV